MRRILRPVLVALIQVLIVASLGGKLLYDRAHYPRVWVKAAPIDPNLPIRGRYVRLSAVVDASAFPEDAFAPERAAHEQASPVPIPEQAFRPHHSGMLKLDGDRLVALPDQRPGQPDTRFLLWRDESGSWAQTTFPDSLAFFIPEHAKDPSIRQPGEELWIEVTVTPSSQLRPLRLGIRKDGKLEPLQ